MLVLLSLTLLFIAANVTLGYTFSTVARTQMQAMQMTFFFFLPSILLSGFMFPFRGMPVLGAGGSARRSRSPTSCASCAASCSRAARQSLGWPSAGRIEQAIIARLC
jgi:ABC-type transport system involved in multi-copper enzyme maturation permease subunit